MALAIALSICFEVIAELATTSRTSSLFGSRAASLSAAAPSLSGAEPWTAAMYLVVTCGMYWLLGLRWIRASASATVSGFAVD